MESPQDDEKGREGWLVLVLKVLLNGRGHLRTVRKGEKVGWFLYSNVLLNGRGHLRTMRKGEYHSSSNTRITQQSREGERRGLVLLLLRPVKRIGSPQDEGERETEEIKREKMTEEEERGGKREGRKVREGERAD